MIRRMFGNVDSPSDPAIEHFQTYDGRRIHHRGKRAANVGGSPHKVDACESTVEIVTPYWASNSHGKIRAIVNTQHLQQAIQTVGLLKPKFIHVKEQTLQINSAYQCYNYFIAL